MSGQDADTDRTHPSITLAVLSAGGMSYALLQSAVAPALPDFQKALGASETQTAWILTSYLLSASVATPIIGRLGDIHGKKRALVAVLAMLAVGTLISAVGSSLPVILFGRIIQGAGGGIFPLAFSIVRDEFPREKVAGGIGLLSSLLGVGGGLGIVMAGPIINNFSYHWLFWFPFAAVVMSMLLTIALVPESPYTAPSRINWGAAALMSIGLTAVLMAVSQTSSWGWGSPKTIVLLAVGLAVMVAWVRREIRTEIPLVDMTTMRLRAVWTTNLVALLLGAGMYSSFIVLPGFVETPARAGYGFAATVGQAGVFMLPSALLILLIGQTAGRIDARFGSRLPLISGCGFAALGFALLTVSHAYEWEVYVASSLLGLGIGLAFAAMANLIVQAVPADQTGVATGVNTVTRTVGGAFGGQIAATILTGSAVGVSASALPSEGGFTLAFGLVAGWLVIATLAGLTIPKPDRPTGPRPRLAEPKLAGAEAGGG